MDIVVVVQRPKKAYANALVTLLAVYYGMTKAAALRRFVEANGRDDMYMAPQAEIREDGETFHL